jgi:hypothetical protein
MDLLLKPESRLFGILRAIAPFRGYGELRVTRSFFVQKVSDSRPDVPSAGLPHLISKQLKIL